MGVVEVIPSSNQPGSNIQQTNPQNTSTSRVNSSNANSQNTSTSNRKSTSINKDCEAVNKIVIEIQEITLLYLIMSHKTALVFFNMIQNQLLLNGYYPNRKLLLTLSDSENKYMNYNENLHKYYRDLLYKEKVLFKSDLNSNKSSQYESKSESNTQKRQFKEESSFQKNNLKEYFNFFSNKSSELIKQNKLVNKKVKSYIKNDELYNYYNTIYEILNKTNSKESKKYSNLRDDINILKKIIKKMLKTQLEKHTREVVKTSNKNSSYNNSNIDETADYNKMLTDEKEYVEKTKICIKFIKPESNDITSISNMALNFFNANEIKKIKEDVKEEFKSTALSKFVDVKMENLISLRLIMDSTYEEELRKYKMKKVVKRIRKREIFRDLNSQYLHYS